MSDDLVGNIIDSLFTLVGLLLFRHTEKMACHLRRFSSGEEHHAFYEALGADVAKVVGVALVVFQNGGLFSPLPCLFVFDRAGVEVTPA